MVLFIGDDWAEDHHDVYVMDESGAKVTARRLPEGLAGISAFHAMIAGQVSDSSEVIIGIETDRGLWVQALVTSGYRVYAINPMAAARYRERHSVSGAKSDAGDAKMLADLVRTDRHNHRLVAGDTDDVDALKVLARAHQNLVWSRTEHVLRLRSTLREYFPAALETFDDLHDRDTLAVLAVAGSPKVAARLTVAKIRGLLVKAGRRRYLDKRASEIHAGLQAEHLHAPDPVAHAYAVAVTTIVALISELNRQIDLIETELAPRFKQHPDADIYLSLPGLGVILGARVLGEFGDDPNRYADGKSRRNYAGTSPITIASGKRRAVVARHARNKRLYDAIDQWAFCSISASPGSRLFYDQRKAAGDSHHQALRALANRLVGILHGCLTHRTPYNEHTAWGHRQVAA